MIKLRDITFGYDALGGSFHLGPVTIDIPKGEISFWMGPNGSGKSTLARIVCGELGASSGTIDGLRGSALYYHQNTSDNVFPDLRVNEHIRAISGEDRGLRILKWFPELRSVLRKYPDELSGGRVQLLAFAVALLRDYDLYIFDEVANHLDPDLAERVLAVIANELVETAGKHCVVITHDIRYWKRCGGSLTEFAEGLAVHSERRVGATDVTP